MRVQLGQQAREVLGQSDVVMITERVDDVARRIGQRVTMGLPEVLDRPRPRHGTQRGRRWGWTAVIWLASLVPEGDHRTVSMETSLQGMHHTLRHLTAQVVDPLDCREDRLSPRLHHVSQPPAWHRIERAVHARSMEVDALPQDVIRCEAPTVSGDHEVTAAGRVQGGQRKEDPTRPPLTSMMGSLDPMGMPLSTEVWSGARAEDGVDLPSIERLRPGLQTPGLVCVGEGKRSAWDTRASLARPQDCSVSPFPLTGAPAEAMDAWSTAGVTQREAGAGAPRGRTNDRGHEGRAAEGSACARTCGALGGDGAWRERVGVVRSPRHAHHQAAGWATRLRHAETPLAALTPPRGRGKRPSTDAATRVEAMALGLTAHRVEAWRSVVWDKQVEQTTQDVGRGRGAVSREKRVLQKTRSPLTPSARQEAPSAARRHRCGWKACVTQAGHPRRSVPEAVGCSRNASRVERLFPRLKSRVHMAPLLVTRNDHIEGLTSLLTLGGRVLTVTAWVLRRSLETAQARLPGVHPENTRKRTDTPTAERILQACSDIALTSITHTAGEDILPRLTPFSGAQEDMLQRLG